MSSSPKTIPSTSKLLQYRPPYPYTSSLRELIISNNKPLNGFIIYRKAYHNIIKKQVGYLKINHLSFIVFRLWKQEPMETKLHYCDLARKVGTMRFYPRISIRRNDNNDVVDVDNKQQPASSIQQNPPPPTPSCVPQNNTRRFDENSRAYIDFKELELHMNQGITFPQTTPSVFEVSSFGTSFV
ncbi:745_t:CDS:1 [Funneliformis geosporum]|uniref:15581_t:CDS:1 n=1 Tax=Funneliformis geosporum TaxID=1117311 RepID=A0A9W4WTR9_9GLOM|nr:745_t:CDS:1 [Funneliformis geosporum]CAI2185322.1 15581_t:CDS:1 [Funneliformis geosporum]